MGYSPLIYNYFYYCQHWSIVFWIDLLLIWFHANFDLPLSLCVKVSPSLWSALLSASQLEKEGFKATPATNREKQSLRLFYLLSCFLSLFWFICDSVSFVFKEKSLILFFVLLKPVFLSFLLTCSFALSFFLSHSFSAFKYHHLFKSLFRFSFGSIAHYLSTLPLIFVCSSLFNSWIARMRKSEL